MKLDSCQEKQYFIFQGLISNVGPSYRARLSFVLKKAKSNLFHQGIIF